MFATKCSFVDYHSKYLTEKREAHDQFHFDFLFCKLIFCTLEILLQTNLFFKVLFLKISPLQNNSWPFPFQNKIFSFDLSEESIFLLI